LCLKDLTDLVECLSMTVLTGRWRYVLLSTVAIGCGWWGYRTSIHSHNDWLFFEVGARVLVHFQHQSIYGGNPLHLYADNVDIQIGPPALVLVAATERLPFETINILFAMVMAVLGVVAIGAVQAVGRGFRPGGLTTRRTQLLGLAALPLAAVWGFDGGAWKHLDDALALSLAVVAAVFIARGRHWYLVGLLLGTAVATKPWVLILTPMVWGIARSDRSRTVLLMVVVAALWWLPFVIAAPGTVQGLGHFMIAVQPGSVLHLVGLRGEVQSWLRPTQFVVGVAVGVVVAVRRHWTAAPLAALAVRVVTDPFSYGYYGLGPVLFALLWDTTRPGSKAVPSFTIATLVVEYLLPILGVDGNAIAAAKLVWAAAMLVGIWRSARNSNAMPIPNWSPLPSSTVSPTAGAFSL
jgi:hypothetical protein